VRASAVSTSQEGRDGIAAATDADHALVATLATGFVHKLRSLGVDVPVGAVINYVQALALIGSADRNARYWAGRATLVCRPEDIPVYSRAFREYWIGTDAADGFGVEGAQQYTIAIDDPGFNEANPEEVEGDDDGEIISLRYSSHEVLREKDFADYTPQELRESAAIMARMRLTGTPRPSRRQVRSRNSHGRPDLRRTVRNAMRTNGEPINRAFRQRSEQPRRLVLLLDISGSMEDYARALLRFVHASIIARRKVEAFALGTRLTRLTRELSTRDPDRAFDAAAKAVADWSGGTRLGKSIQNFNDEWGVRGMARGAIVVILSDGWDRGSPEEMDEQMQRLSRVAHKVVWVNPLKATDGYAPLAQGMAAALPHVDAFIEGHSLSALDELARVISSSDHGSMETPTPKTAVTKNVDQTEAADA